jgi:hypothetical protein
MQQKMKEKKDLNIIVRYVILVHFQFLIIKLLKEVYIFNIKIHMILYFFAVSSYRKSLSSRLN